jgi:predicted Zn-dependent protease
MRLLMLLALVLLACEKSVPEVPFGVPAGTKMPKVAPGMRLENDVPKDAENEFSQAEDLRSSGALAGAALSYENLLLKAPHSASALYGAAYSLLSLPVRTAEQSKNAQNYAERLRTLAPSSAEASVLQSLLEEQKGNPTAALDAAMQAVRKNETLPEANLRLAQMSLATGQPANAAPRAQLGISLSRGLDPRYYSALAESYYKENKLDSCESLVKYASLRFPGEIKLTLYKGYFLEFAGRLDEAEASYRKILALAPGNTEALSAIQTLGKKPKRGGNASAGTPQERMAEAIAVLNPLVQTYPENLPLREALGVLYLKAQDASAAKTQFTEIANQDPNYPEIQSRLFEAIQLQNILRAVPAANALLADSLRHQIERARADVANEDPNDAQMGHYLVRYGATPKEFFSRYPVSSFKKESKVRWTQEQDGNHYSIYFDKKGLYAVRGVLQVPFRSALRKNMGIVGEGRAPEIFKCDTVSYQAVLWEGLDNFEILFHQMENDSLTWLIRLEPSQVRDGGNLCSYLPMALGKSDGVKKP